MIGDMAVPKRMKKLAAGFYNRAAAYDLALDSRDADRIAELIGEHLGRDGRPLRGLARYISASDSALAKASLDDLLSAGPPFADPDRFAEETAR